MHMLRMELQNGETEELKEDFGQDILGIDEREWKRDLWDPNICQVLYYN